MLFSRTIEANAPEVLVDKLVRLGTEIGADVHEGLSSSSRRQGLAKMTAARHDSSEIAYWLKLLIATGLANQDTVRPFLDEANELNKAITGICIRMHKEIEKE